MSATLPASTGQQRWRSVLSAAAGGLPSTSAVHAEPLTLPFAPLCTGCAWLAQRVPCTACRPQHQHPSASSGGRGKCREGESSPERLYSLANDGSQAVLPYAMVLILGRRRYHPLSL